MEEGQTPKPPPTVIDLEDPDLTMVRAALAVITLALQNGPKSRERSLVITKLQEASMWANEGLRLE